MTMLRSAQQQQQLRSLLKETIILLCRNGLSFDTELNIEALVGVTIDHSEVILVSLRETIESEQKKSGTGAALYSQADNDVDSVKSSNSQSLACPPGSERLSTIDLPRPITISPLIRRSRPTAASSLLPASPSCSGSVGVGSSLLIASSVQRQRKRQRRSSSTSLEESHTICSDTQQQQQPTSSIDHLQAMVQSQRPSHNPPPVKSSFLISNICGKDADDRRPSVPQLSPQSRHSSDSDSQDIKTGPTSWSTTMGQTSSTEALPADIFAPTTADNSGHFREMDNSPDLKLVKEEPATGSLDYGDGDISVDGENAFDSTDRSEELGNCEAATSSGNVFGSSQSSDIDMDAICRTILAYDGWCVPLRDIQRLRLHSIPSAVVRSAMEVLDRGDLGRFCELGSNLGVFYKCPPHLIDQKTLASYGIPFHTYASWYSAIPAPNATNRHNERYWGKVVLGSPYTS